MEKQPTIEQIAALAWDLMKSDDDPMFSGCLKDHQEKLIYHARDVQRTGVVGDDFERKIAEVLVNPEAAIAEIKAKLALPVEPELVVEPEQPVVKPAKTKRGKS